MSTIDLAKYVKAHAEFISGLNQTMEKTKAAVIEEIARCTRTAIVPIIQKEIDYPISGKQDLSKVHGEKAEIEISPTIQVVDNGVGHFNIFIHTDRDLFSLFFKERHVEVYRNGASFITIQNELLAQIP